LHVDIFKLLDLPTQKLVILANEASRQRSIDTILLAQAFHSPKNVSEMHEESKLVHGDYTKGFYKNQLSLLKANQGK
jgi:hypothetical protein